MSEDYNQWRLKVQQWQAPLKKWAQSKEGREMFSKIVEEAPDKHVSPLGLTPQGIEIIATSPISRFLLKCNANNKGASIIIDDMKVVALVTDSEVLETVPLEIIEPMQKQAKTCGTIWNHMDRFGCLIYFDGDDPKGHWTAWYAEPVKKNPRNALECSTIFFLFLNHMMHEISKPTNP